MKSVKDLKTKEDVQNLTDEEMYYIDKSLRVSRIAFISQDVSDEFYKEWAIRGILA